MKFIYNKYKLILVSLLTALFMLSCVEDETCGENTITGLIVAVKNSGDDSATDLDELNQSAVSNWMIRALGDTAELLSKSTAYQYGIPFDLEQDSVSLVFYIKDADAEYLSDTLVFKYHQTDMRLISVACGFAPEFEITGGRYSVSVLDSVVVEDVVVNNNVEITNVTLYY